MLSCVRGFIKSQSQYLRGTGSKKAFRLTLRYPLFRERTTCILTIQADFVQWRRFGDCSCTTSQKDSWEGYSLRNGTQLDESTIHIVKRRSVSNAFLVFVWPGVCVRRIVDSPVVYIQIVIACLHSSLLVAKKLLTMKPRR